MDESKEDAARMAELQARREKAGEESGMMQKRGVNGPAKAEGRAFPAAVTDRLRCAVVENMSEAAVVVEGDGTIVYENGRLAEMLHMTPNQVVGLKLRDVFSEEDRARFEEIFGRGCEKGGRGEFTVASHDGSLLPVSVSGGKAPLEGTEGVSSYITDMAVRKRAEEVLRNSHDDLEKCVEERTAELTAANDQLKKEAREREQAEIGLRRERSISGSSSKTRSTW